MRVSLLVLVLTLAVSPAMAQDVKIAQWNIGLFDADAFSRLKLTEYGTQINPDIMLLEEVPSAGHINRLKTVLGREDDYSAISSFEPADDDQEVAIVSRYPLADVIEFDRAVDHTGPDERKLERVNLPGIADVGVSRGFLVARVPDLKLILMVVHLKSSRGQSGRRDHSNAQKREVVTAAMAVAVNDLSEVYPDHSFVVAGDFNVGERDVAKNGTKLFEDKFDGPATNDRYDETHALLKDGLIDGLKMTSLTAELGETFVGDDDIPDFPGTGPIDCIYVSGPMVTRFAKAKRADTSFGSDHRSVFTVFDVDGDGSVDPGMDDGGSPVASGLKISKLLPNPVGEDRGKESVTISNNGEAAVTITGWKLRDRSGHMFNLTGEIPANSAKTFVMPDFEMPLNNNGDEVELLDATELVRNRVSYTGAQAVAGEDIVFGD